MTAILDRVRSDENLARRAIGGDVPAFDELYRRYRPGLAAYGARLLGDREGGEDVAQIALFNAYRALARGTQPNNLQAWLYRIARNAAFEVARRRREQPVADDPGEPADGAHESSAVRSVLLDGLRDLPDRQRRTFVLRELHGYSSAEAADELHLTVPQVEQALFAARNRLAEHLVFGGRLDCEQLRQLDPSSLDLAERRALRAHSRSCPSCRTSLRRSALGAVVIPLGLVASVREGIAATLGGAVAGAPAAVKVGAAVVTAAVATGVPASVEVATDPGKPRAAAIEVVAEAEPPAADLRIAPEPESPEPPAFPVAVPVEDVPVEQPVETVAEQAVEDTGVSTEPPAATPESSDDPTAADGTEDGDTPPASGEAAPEPGPPESVNPPDAAVDGVSGETGAEVLGVDGSTATDGTAGGGEPPCEGDVCPATEPAVTTP
ncbi:MAG: sigma-70 family RNA polymerase sigma factor [Gaiellales bacterium]